MTMALLFPHPPVPEAIDLGLSVKWASFNLGASKPEEYGDYYAWGETEPYYSSLYPLMWKAGKEAGYDWPSYKWSKGSYNTITKYCTNASYGYEGFTDNKTVLDPEDDAAIVNLGSSWRMPTDAEWAELQAKCTWEWVSVNDVYGYEVVGPSGNSIFLPAAKGIYYTAFDADSSYGIYWASSLSKANEGSACDFMFDYGGVGSSGSGRSNGYSVRPVCE